jgi:hypothetical protein
MGGKAPVKLIVSLGCQAIPLSATLGARALVGWVWFFRLQAA